MARVLAWPPGREGGDEADEANDEAIGGLGPIEPFVEPLLPRPILTRYRRGVCGACRGEQGVLLFSSPLFILQGSSNIDYFFAAFI